MHTEYWESFRKPGMYILSTSILRTSASTWRQKNSDGGSPYAQAQRDMHTRAPASISDWDC